MDSGLDDDVVSLLDGEGRGVQVVDPQQLVSRSDARLLRSAVRFDLHGRRVTLDDAEVSLKQVICTLLLFIF